ncbi:MAG: iron-sulfur cluster insertion protein ErpA [Alphaproteobacteria bacterium]|nr:iron-sulfur cluster insertion protein ErpA [Alphaproteobacteria bacterium]
MEPGTHQTPAPPRKGPADLPPPIGLTAAAARRLKEILQDEPNPEQMLRLSISGGGCSGFQYGFKFDTATSADDVMVSTDGATLVIDNVSLMYVAGSVVDFEETLESAMFVVKNPQATASCGCGTSFSVAM